MSNPAYGLSLTRVASLALSLGAFCKSGHHHFRRDEVSLRDAALFDLGLTGHRPLTDVYLLGLAKKMGGTSRHVRPHDSRQGRHRRRP